MRKLKYFSYTIALQEVPDEVSLIVNISGCPYHCDGCHSDYLRKYEGRYICEDIKEIIRKYEGLITCVCFMGGDQNCAELVELLRIVHDYNLKTCLYTGANNVSNDLHRAMEHLDYVKIGSYNKELGDLSSVTTNQYMLKKISNTSWENITNKFTRSKGKSYENDK